MARLMPMAFWLGASALAASVPTLTVAAPAPGADAALEGVLREKGTGNPLAGVNVFVLPAKLKAVTDEDGRFKFEAVPEGAFEWVVNLAGYERLNQADVQTAESAGSPRALFLERMSYQIYETTVFGKQAKRDAKTKSLSGTQLSRIAGTGGDAIKGIQNLPGVSRPPSFTSQVIIEGSAPEDTKYTIDGHEVPIIFHFGGLSSVVQSETLDRIDYLSAGFGPEYGGTLAGNVGAWIKSPRRDRRHGFGFADILNAGALVEGPLGAPAESGSASGGFLLSARFSYISLLLGAAVKGNDDFDLTVAPTYSDALAVYEKDLTPIDRFKANLVGSIDTLEFLLKSPSSPRAARGVFYNRTAFFRLIPELTHRHSSRTTSRFSFGLGRDWIRFNVGSNYFKLVNTNLSVRGEVERRFGADWTSILGIDNNYSWPKVEFSFPESFGAGGGARLQTSVSPTISEVSVFNRTTYQPADSPWSVSPGLRFSYFSISREGVPEPRLSVRYALTPSLSLRTSGGYYAQAPAPQQADPTVGNPEIKTSRAWHATLGAEQDLRGDSTRGWVVSSDVFYKDLDRLVIPSAELVVRDNVLTAERYSNRGRGRVYGISNLVRADLRPWSGWVSYTLSRSLRTEPDAPEHLFQYDQTHILALVASVDVAKTWTFSTRFRLTTGDPITPVVGSVFDSDRDRYRAIPGEDYSDRLDSFYSLDLRADKRWIFDTWTLSAYLDVQNATNRKNPESLTYSYDYRQKDSISLLPIIPTLGVKGEF